MKGDRKVRRYLAARRDLTALMRQLQDYPELSGSRPFLTALNEATIATDTALGALTGGQLARALRLWAEALTPKNGRDTDG